MGLRKENFNIMGVHWKIKFLGGGLGSRKTNVWGEIVKGRVELGQFADLRWGLAQKSELFF